jgi:GTPase SAR1 family protein
MFSKLAISQFCIDLATPKNMIVDVSRTNQITLFKYGTTTTKSNSPDCWFEQLSVLFPFERLFRRPTTIRNAVAQFDVAQPRRCRLVCWDLGGQVGLRSLWDKYFADADAAIFVVDTSAPDRFEETATILSFVIHLVSINLFNIVCRFTVAVYWC